MSEKNINSALVRRVNKLLESRVEHDKDTLEALKELSTFFTENTLNSRRNLRSKIERRSLAINEEFLSTFREVKASLDDVYQNVLAMNTSVQSMTNRLQATKAQTSQLIEQTSKLQGESQILTMQQEVASAFIRNFQLTPSELTALHGSTRESPITEEFFSVVNKVQDIHGKCRVLMQSGYQTLALDIMQRMTLLQESALERLYRWTQTQCKNIENERLAPLLIKAMSKLQDRPVLFKYILDEYCTARRTALVGSFIDALTLGENFGTPNPIEMHANDPKRYVGDMLAWLHQVVPVEKENILILVKGCDKTDVSDQVKQTLSNITEGLCHPLKSRIEHVISTEAPATVLYSITTLIRFYRAITEQVIPDSVLDQTLLDLLTLSEKSFLSRLQRETRIALGERAEPPGNDLVPAPSVSRLLSLLNEILSVASIAEDREKDMLQIVSCIIDPLLQEVNETASRLPTVDMAVYLLNCMHQIQSTLALYEYMDQRLERLQAQSDAQIDTLTSEQASSLVAHLNLGSIYTILQGRDQGPLSSIPGMDALSVKEFTNKLEAFLVMPDVLLLPQISLLQSNNHRMITQKRSFEVIGAIYRQLFDACHDPKNLYQNPNSLFSRTPEDLLQTLISQ
ncbi:PREDICTED: conserved oligomeric Golgi complex subunit 6 [Cyphomyrmex costatus]|uniref:Conserved oligomeric Golgi complex subunit 6 n=1 Tax=Cyphomyrmex costatus TaxID=456900 RepID=A0A195CU49_9HYME|nr:PREDICTED: conserved oligomeric Golgi complex subunit 6 [Cyphomyrmex costatus]KYN04213.1 Conserved oligomeric Golgi complex subunit 6 [Cyphomyrmex costatus]